MKIHSVRFLCSCVNRAQYPPPLYPEIAIFGRSNAGKSSLLNCLVNRRNLASVSQRPGRTQSLNFYLVNEGFYFVDLPGYGYAKVPERVRAEWETWVQNYLKERKTLRLLLFLVDIRRRIDGEDLYWIECFGAVSVPFVLVFTKGDKCRMSERRYRISEGERIRGKGMLTVLDFSVYEGAGKKALWLIISKVLSESPPARRD